ncbi:MAG: hypothetical protein LBP39_03415 [Rickettsiales bacterium]|jgi:hypothetical protein|nr:hypothetical protein [Rickettsiales bacterium]
MKTIDNLNEFIEKIDALKKSNPLDLSSDQDLSIAIMNLISIEEHLFFSGAKTRSNYFYDLIEEIRECRKELLGKIIKSYRGEVWCISKHLLASCMRLSEVATKALHSGNKKEAYDLFNKAYDLYCLFWGLNLESIDEETTKKLTKEIDEDTIKNLSRDTETAPPRASSESDKGEYSNEIDSSDSGKQTEEKKNKVGLGAALKNFISKAVNCCRE